MRKYKINKEGDKSINEQDIDKMISKYCFYKTKKDKK